VPRALWWRVLLDIMGVGLVIPLLPSYARDLGAGPLFTGLLGTAYGLSQLVGASVLGRLSDVRGRRFVLFISLAGAASGYTCLALAVGVFESLPLLFLSRLPIGLAKQIMTVARATVGDCTAAQGDLRTRRMGRLGMVAGTGFIFGPAIGGLVSPSPLGGAGTIQKRRKQSMPSPATTALSAPFMRTASCCSSRMSRSIASCLAVPPVLAVCLFCAALVIAPKILHLRSIWIWRTKRRKFAE
jgi:MFS family permease